MPRHVLLRPRHGTGSADVEPERPSTARVVVPVLSAVLTPQRFDEHDAGDVAFFTDHLVTKGVELAQACANILQSGRQLAASA